MCVYVDTYIRIGPSYIFSAVERLRGGDGRDLGLIPRGTSEVARRESVVYREQHCQKAGVRGGYGGVGAAAVERGLRR